MEAGDELETPLSPQGEENPRSGAMATYHRQLSARDGFVLLISIQIGSGIFTSPSQVDGNVASPAAALLAWGVAGVLAWAGATTFAELGTMLPQAGGMQEYLRYMYGDMVSFSMAWIWIIVVKPTAMAILSILLVESVSMGLSDTSSRATDFYHNLFACLAFLTIALVNCCSSTKSSSRIGEAFVALKFAIVVLIVAGAFATILIHVFSNSSSSLNSDWFTKSWFHARPGQVDWPTVDWWTLVGHFSAAIYAAFWAYSGWDNANFIAGEMINPSLNLPRAIHSAMGTVIFCFLLTNVSYYILLPWDAVSETDAIAVTAAGSLLGIPGRLLVALLVALSCAGALNGNLFVTGRLTMAAVQRGYLPQVFGEYWAPTWSYSARSLNTAVTPRGGLLSFSWLRRNGERSTNQEWIQVPITDEPHEEAAQANEERELERSVIGQQGAPINAILLSTSLTVVYIFVGNFHILLTFIGIAEYSFFLLTVIGLLILRAREPMLDRPYKPSILIPVTFCFVNILVVIRTIIFVPVQALVLLLLLAAGVGLRVWTKRKAVERRF